MPEPTDPPAGAEEGAPTGREAEVLAARRASLDRLGRERAFAISLRSVLDVDEPTSTRTVREAHPDLAPDTTTAERFVVAGRVILKRDLGKIKFLTIRDGEGDLQVVFAKASLPEDRFAELDEVVKQGTRDFRPEVAPHMKIGLEPPGLGLRLEPQRMAGATRDPVVDIGAKPERRTAVAMLDFQLYGEEWRVLDDQPAFLDRRHQEIFVPFALQHRSEQLYQRRPADRGLQIEPGAVRGDAHVEVPAKRRVPKVHRWRPLTGRLARNARDRVQAVPRLGLLRHGRGMSSGMIAGKYNISAAPPASLEGPGVGTSVKSRCGSPPRRGPQRGS
jgi:hypothetical protein